MEKMINIKCQNTLEFNMSTLQRLKNSRQISQDVTVLKMAAGTALSSYWIRK